MMRLIDLFSGIGGFSYAAEHLVGGFQTVQFVEKEPFCQRILCKHWPDVPIHDDICTYQPEPGTADVICGGFPCQDISTAGKQAGIKEGTRSGLFHELMRVVRMVGPRFVILENVAAITSGGLDIVLGELAEAGFDAEWACIPASAVGACHQRDRWWAVAYASGVCAKRWGGNGYVDGAAGEGEGKGDQWQRHGDAAEHCGAATAHTSSADGQRRAEESGRWGGSAADAGGCGIPESGGSTDFANPAHMLSDGGTSEQPRQSGGRSISEPGDGGGADAADAMHSGLQGCRGERGLQQGGSEGEAVWGSSSGGRLNPDWQSYVSEPCLRRGDDGLSGRVDRLKALGNAVVPQVAAIPLTRVRQLMTEKATGSACGHDGCYDEDVQGEPPPQF